MESPAWKDYGRLAGTYDKEEIERLYPSERKGETGELPSKWIKIELFIALHSDDFKEKPKYLA